MRVLAAQPFLTVHRDSHAKSETSPLQSARDSNIRGIQFRHSHVEIAPQTILHAANYLPFVFRMGGFDAQLEGEKSNGNQFSVLFFQFSEDTTFQTH